jgi:hypothetical protein
MQLAAALNQNLLGDERLKTEAENGFPQLVNRRLQSLYEQRLGEANLLSALPA